MHLLSARLHKLDFHRMKYFLLLLLFSLSNYYSFGQNKIADEYRVKLDAYRAMHPPAMVYFHLDKIVYEPGDTIHYKAYQIESEDWKPRQNAQFFDVRIVEKSTEKLVQQEKVIVDNGVGIGAFKLSKDISPGSYRFIADSHLMNFDAADIDFVSNFTISGKVNLTDTDPELSAECFVEGGQIVQGLLCRIVVKCNKDGIGKIVNINGDSLASVPVNNGFSSIKFRPRTTEKLFVQFGDKKFPLPEIRKFGTVVSIDNQENDANLAIIFSGKLAPGVSEQRMLLLAEHDGRTGLYFDIIAQNGKTIQMFPKAALKHGINRFLVIDSAMNIQNERLYYYHNPSMMYFKSEKTVRSEGNEDVITVDINAEDKDGKAVDANLSIAVTDSIHCVGHVNGQNIVESFSIQQNISRPIDGLGDAFKNNRISDSRMLDLYMLSSTYGRYKWQDVRIYEYKPLEPFRVPYADERRAPKLSGYQPGNGLYYWNPSVDVKNGKASITLKAPKGTKLHYTVVGFDKKGFIGQTEF